MGLNQTLRYRETQSSATIPFGGTRLVEFLKDRRELIRRDTDAGVFDRYISEFLVVPRRDRYLTSSRSKLQGIVGEIVKNLAKALTIGKNHEPLRDIDDDLHRLVPVDL